MYLCVHNTRHSLQPASQSAEAAVAAPADEEVVNFFFVFVMVWLVLFAPEELLPSFTQRTPPSFEQFARNENFHVSFLGTKNSTRTETSGTWRFRLLKISRSSGLPFQPFRRVLFSFTAAHSRFPHGWPDTHLQHLFPSYFYGTGFLKRMIILRTTDHIFRTTIFLFHAVTFFQK